MVFSPPPANISTRVAWMFSLRMKLRVKPFGLSTRAEFASLDWLFQDPSGSHLSGGGGFFRVARPILLDILMCLNIQYVEMNKRHFLFTFQKNLCGLKRCY